MSEIEPQVWVGNEEPEADEMDPIRSSEDGPINKPSGGLWTSTRSLKEDGEVSSAWIEWMKAEHYSTVEDPQAWVLYPEKDLDVYVIDDVEDAIEVMKPDPRYEGMTNQDYIIDWEDVFGNRDYDAIHLTRQGQIETRFPNYTYEDGNRVKRAEDWRKYSLYGWDCECYLWDDWHFTDVEYAGDVTLPELEY